MKYKINKLEDLNTARRIGEFLTGPFAFEQTWAPNEKAFTMQAPIDSLGKMNHRYWYLEDKGKIIAAIGVRENKYGSAGYEMDSDYVAVHNDFRNQGLAQALLEEMEKFVSLRGGTFMF